MLKMAHLMHKNLATQYRQVSIGGRPLCNLRFTDDIDHLGGSEEELQELTEIWEKTAAGYDLDIRSDKSKILVNSIKPKANYQYVDEWKSV